MEKIFKSLTIIISLTLISASAYLVYNFYSGENQYLQEITNSSLDKLLNETNLKASPPEFLALIKSAQEFNANKDYSNAIKSYLSAHKINPDSSIPYLGIAKIYYQNEKFDFAEKNISNAYTKGGLDTNGLNLYLRILIQNKETTKAKELIKKISEPNTETVFLDSIIQLLDSDTIEFKNDLDKLSKVEATDKFTELSKTLQKSYEIYKTFTDSPTSYLLVLIGQDLVDNQEHVIARPLLFESINQKNDYRDAYVVLGYSLLLSNKLPDASQSLQKALQIDPYLGATHFYYGLTLLKQNQFQQALDSFLQAESSNFESRFELYKNLALASYELAQYEQSYNYFQKSLSINNLGLSDATILAEILIERLAKPVEALNIITTITNNFPNDPKSLALIGYTQVANQNLKDARKNLLESIKINPNSAETYIYIAKLNTAENKKPEALNNLNTAKQIASEQNNQKILNRIDTEIERLNTPNL